MASHPIRPPDWIDDAPTQVEASIEIDASPAMVWKHIADHHAWPEWFDALDAVRPGEIADAVGGGRTVYVKKLALDETFTAWDVNEHFAFAVVGSRLPMVDALAESVRLEPIHDTRTRVVYRQGIAGKRGFDWLVGRAWTRAASALPIALENLKERVEIDLGAD